MQDEQSNYLKRNGGDEEAILCKYEECTGTLKKRVTTTASTKTNKQLPHIQEDYRGPRHHRPTHH